MVAGLPLFKLASLAIKQSAKPVANVIKRGAKESDIFKKYLCYYPGQGKTVINVYNMACINARTWAVLQHADAFVYYSMHGRD
jgi:hypothetical protein